MAKTWGTPTWYFFHSLAEHINEDFYKHNKDTIKDYIIKICTNLPCYECTKHAKQYIRYNLNSNSIGDKEKLKTFFFKFHNAVNKRIQKPEFTDFDKYKRANLIQVYNQFKHVFTRNSSLEKGFCDSLNRRNIIHSLDIFFKHNKANFKWYA